MPASHSTSRPPVTPPEARAKAQVRSPGNNRPKLTDAANLRSGKRSTADQLGPHLYRLPVSVGVWAFSTDETEAAPLPRGLYQQERDPDGEDARYAIRSELPYVHARIVRRDGSGRRSATDYLISAGRDGARVTVTSEQVRRGEWAGAAGLPDSADRKVIEAAATAILRMQPLDREYDGEREAAPRIGADGKVTVPVAETLPTGYLATGPLTRAQALARWRQRIVPVAVGNPKMALVLGAATSAPYLGKLARQSHIVNMDGDSDQGKSTAMKVTAGLYGDPFVKGGLLGSWSGTKVRLPRRLGMLGILPCFLDERGMADFTTPAEWGKAIYSITDGPREVSEHKGNGLRLTAPWDGVLVSAGNGSMLDGLGAGPYAGVGVKRVVSLQAPFTRDADEAEAVIDALRDAYGHPGLAVLEAFTVAEVDRLIRAAIPLVGMPAGGNPRSLAKNLHGHVAGAAMLDQILGTGTTLRDASVVAAREYLEANGHDPEHDADRLLAAIHDCMAAQPARWPTVSQYREHRMPRPSCAQDGTPLDPNRVELPQHNVDRNVAGVRADDGSWFAVVGSAMDDLLTQIGADRAQALGEARRRGWLHHTPSDGNKMGTKVKPLPGRPYRFNLPADDDGQDPGEIPGPAPEPTADGCAACGYTGPMHAPDCSDLPPLPPEPAWDDHEDQDHEPDPWDKWAEPESAARPVREPVAPTCITPHCGLDGRLYPTGAFCDDHRPGAPRAAPELAATGAEDQDHEPEPEARPEVAGDDELAAFARSVRKIDADATDSDISAALAIFHEVSGGVRWVSYAGQVGQAWFAKLAAQHPSMKAPELLAWPRMREVAESGPLTRINYVTKPGKAVRAGKHHVTSYDLNGQHLAALSSAELGDGEPEVIENPRTIDGLIGFPGYVRLGRALKTGHPAFGTRPAGEWLAMPLVCFLVRDLKVSVPAAEVVYWPRKGRRLSVYASRVRDARERLMGAEQTGPVRLALAALKSQANAFVGMFHSETYSHGGFYRPDWYDQIVATAEANALRALAKCPVPPVAKMADSAYWVADSEPYVPAGLTISARPGKWKLDRHGPVTDDLISAIRDQAPAGVRDAVIAIDADREAGR